MPDSTRRTATYAAEVIAAAERVRTSPTHRQALVELAGTDPSTESALFNELARIALDLVERRALEIGYRQLAGGADASDPDAGATDRGAEGFLHEQALAGFDYDEDEDPAALLAWLAGDGT